MRRVVLYALVLALAGCAAKPRPPAASGAPRSQAADDVVRLPPVGKVGKVNRVGKFSRAKPGDVLPSGWQIWQISAFKKATHYQLVSDNGRTVVKASAHGSASGLIYPLQIDLKQHPLLRWRWKVPSLIKKADNTKRHTEDAPVRIIVSFAGDQSKLPLDERLFAQQFKMFTRTELPYATLMYIWENRAPRDTVIPNRHTARIKMIVAESGGARLGEWHEETRNVYEDFKRAFGEEPPPVKSIAIMTDTDNTGEEIDAYYGDIAFVEPAMDE